MVENGFGCTRIHISRFLIFFQVQISLLFSLQSHELAEVGVSVGSTATTRENNIEGMLWVSECS